MDPILSPEWKAAFEVALIWVGFGTCVGLLAKVIMPGKDPGGAIATMLMGITGVVIGCGVYALIYRERLSPITSVGLLCGTAGALLILFFYRVLSGYVWQEGGTLPIRRQLTDTPAPHRRRRRRRRRPEYDYLED